MSLTEFLAWEPGDGRHWQLVDGQPWAMAPATPRHGAIQSNVNEEIVNHLNATESICRCVTTPGLVTPVAADRNMRIPDIAVTRAPPTTDMVVALPDPVLIIEVLSPGNQTETWINVWTYTLIPSVQEVLVFHSEAVRVDLLRRRPDGTWPAASLPITKGDVTMESIGMSMPLEAVYRRTPLAS